MPTNSKMQTAKKGLLMKTEIEELLPESMVIDNKITGEAKKKPPRDYSPEEEEDEEQTPEKATVIDAATEQKKINPQKGPQNLELAIKQDEKELKKLKKKAK